MRPRLLSVAGVSSVSVIGGEVQEYRIALNPDKMRHLGVSLTQTMEALENFNSNSSGGIKYDYGNEYLVKTSVSTSDIEQLGRTPIGGNGEAPVTLADIADISLAPTLPEIGKASLNAQPAVLLTVTKQPHVGSIELTDQLLSELASLKGSLPAGININT